jgi:predicted NBD/HSP70 family sugar kinase
MRALGLDVGGTNLRIAIVNNAPAVEKTFVKKLPAGLPEAELLQFIVDATGQAIRLSSFMELGIGITGVIHEDGTLTTSNIPVFNGTSISSSFAARFSRGVIVDNDVRCALRGEVHLGSARSCKNVACITLGTGIGGALLLDGRIRRGPHNTAGEIGLAAVVTDEGHRRLCTLEDIWRRTEGRQRDSQTHSRDDSVRRNSRDVNMLDALAGAILTVYRTVDVERIVFGGVATGFGENFIQRLLDVIDHARGNLRFDCDLVLAELGIFAGAVGAACLVLESKGLLPRL